MKKKIGLVIGVVIITLCALYLTIVQPKNEAVEITGMASNSLQEKPVLTDAETVPEIEVFTAYDEPLNVFNFLSDAMDRGSHDYSEHPLLIDPSAYQKKEIARGDVVVYEAEFFNGKSRTVGRVVGLPGEEVEVVDGQVFIDGQKLNTFYGRAHRVGTSSSEEFKAWFEENSSSASTTTGMEELFEMDIEKFRLAQTELFVVGDDWFRGHQNRVASSEIQGEVLGYYVEKTVEGE